MATTYPWASAIRTTREGEVLSWLSKGKTNRDIAQILDASAAI
jgi:DNA-binding CsgD family transcriptional regulator